MDKQSTYITLMNEIEKSFDKMELFFYGETLEIFIRSKYEELENYRLAFGVMIRLKILSPKSIVYKLFVKNGIGDTNIMTLILLEHYYIYKRNQYLNGLDA